MWAFMVKMKGKKFAKRGGIVNRDDVDRESCYWHTIEKTSEEILRSRRVAALGRSLRSALIEKGRTEAQALVEIDVDYDGGFIRWRTPNPTGTSSAARLFFFDKVSETMQKSASAYHPDVDLDRALLESQA